MATSIQENISSTSLVTERNRTRLDFSEAETPRVSEARSTRSSSTCVDTVPAGKRAFYRSRLRHRRIDWRWQRAHEIHAAESSLNPLYDDSHTERLLEYLELADTNPQAARRHDPSLARAWEIYEAGDEQEGLLRAWLLTELSLPEIAERVELPEAVVEAYVAMFYDVRDRRSKSDWVILHVIKLHTREFPDFQEREFATWQFEALDGARALDNFLDLARIEPVHGGDVTRNIDEAILRILRYCIYVAMVTTPVWEVGNPRVWQRLYFEQRKRQSDGPSILLPLARNLSVAMTEQRSFGLAQRVDLAREHFDQVLKRRFNPPAEPVHLCDFDRLGTFRGDVRQYGDFRIAVARGVFSVTTIRRTVSDCSSWSGRRKDCSETVPVSIFPIVYRRPLPAPISFSWCRTMNTALRADTPLIGCVGKS